MEHLSQLNALKLEKKRDKLSAKGSNGSDVIKKQIIST